MPRLPVVFLSFTCLSCVSSVSSLSVASENPSRRAFFRKIPVAIAGLATAGIVHHTFGCGCSTCTFKIQPAIAFERRDVGGDNPSPETAAMNLQAFETQQRLEREGVKLETAEEQRTSLTAALADYSYTPTTPGKKDAGAKKQKKES